MASEAAYQQKLIKRIKRDFPGVVVLKNDEQYQQGMLDLTLLFGDWWAALEVKAKASSPMQPNQPYFVEKLNDMSFAAVIYPENEEEVLTALQRALTSGRRACVPQS